MTLSERNNFLRGGIFFAAFSLCLIAAGGFFAFPAYPDSATAAALRPQGIIQGLIKSLVKPSAYVPFWTMAGAVLYSFVGIILIHYFFEKTQCPEILFFAFFVMSLSFEFTRIAIPLKEVFSFSSVYLITASRFLLFGRYFGLFSLFISSVYAAGLDSQKQQNAFFILIMATLVIVLNVPVDSLSWDSSLRMLNGYNSMFAMVEAGIWAVTLITFFIIYLSSLIAIFIIIAHSTRFLNSSHPSSYIPSIEPDAL